MKKMLCVVVMVIVFMIPSIARSQTGFLFGMAAGATLFGGGNTANGGTMILYTAPEKTLMRIKSPLMTKMSSWMNLGGGQTFYHIFQRSLSGEDASNYEVLQIVRVFHGERPDNAAIWFCYIEKNQLAPVALPKNIEKK